MKRKTYPTKLSDEQWKSLCSMLPPPERFGRKRSVDLCEVFNAFYYLTCTDCQWRLLPCEFLARQTVSYFRLWRDTEWFVAINDKLRQELRGANGNKAHLSAPSLC